ncbi:hypothetical protein A2U01_0049562 [Trifolium medium]|uniref:Uncharacterized protein n=1 Tax=Trifolium medium TaxID=97028 RepID=A0A392QWU3_9FABA|nr:hypothetical protein [Trifolium medium]
MLTPIEEEELLIEARKVNDSLEGELKGMVPVYCWHTPKKNEDFHPVVQSREDVTPTLGDLVKKEVMKPLETGMRNCMLESLRVYPVGATSKTKCFKQPPRRFIKPKRFKWKLKKEKSKSNSKGTCSWLDNCKLAPLRKVNRRNKVEVKRKYPP